MPFSETTPVDFANLREKGPSAGVIVRMMLAFNDISLANQGMETYDKPLPPRKMHLRMGGRLYFLRLQLGHLNEALKLIGEISNDTKLCALVPKCTSKVRDQYELLRDCQKGGKKHAQFKKAVELVRHKVTFHYDPGMVEAAIADRASRDDARTSMVCRGDEIDRWRFKVADHVVDSIVCRQIWKIPRDANLREEADRMAMFAHGVCVAFLEFSGEFIFRYLKS